MSNRIKYDFTGANNKFAKKLKSLGGDVTTLLRYIDESTLTEITSQSTTNINFEALITGFGSSSVNLFGENLDITDDGIIGTISAIGISSANYGYIDITEGEIDIGEYDVVDLKSLFLNESFLGTEFNDTLSGYSGNDRLIGGGGRDKLIGNSGNDVLNGGSGIDDMRGGAGNDRYIVDRTGDVIREGSNQGTDLVKSSANYILRDSDIENLTLTGSEDINGTGNTSANTIRGNSGANRLNGDAGRDILFGGEGNDKLFGEADNDVLTGGLGNDQLTGGAGRDKFCISTGIGKDIIKDYGTGNDRIQLLGGLEESDLTIRQAGDNVKIKYEGDLMAIVQDTLIADLTFI